MTTKRLSRKGNKDQAVYDAIQGNACSSSQRNSPLTDLSYSTSVRTSSSSSAGLMDSTGSTSSAISCSLNCSVLSDSSNKSVKFGNISIREFDVTVGDNPACSSGVPISLGWKYNPVHEEFPVEVFENYRDGQRCSADELKLSERVRYQMLVEEWKISKSQIARAERQCRQTKNERQQSLEHLHCHEARDGNDDTIFVFEETVNKTFFGRNLGARLLKILRR